MQRVELKGRVRQGVRAHVHAWAGKNIAYMTVKKMMTLITKNLRKML